MTAAATTPRHFPSRIADLSFTVALPEDWIAHDLPDGEPDFSGPAFLHPLALVTGRNAAMAFCAAARPAYEDGTLHDWMWFLLRHNGLTPRTVGPSEANGHPAMIGEAAQDGDLGPITTRFALIEDGGRMVQFSLTAPDEFDDRAKRVWFAALESFKLESPRGPTVALQPAAVVPAAVESEDTTGYVADGEDGNTFAAHALAADAASFDPEQELNARLRNNGIGFVPNLVAQDDQARCGTFAAGALMASVTIPFGWHIIDDTRRTLVFDPGNKTQINLSLIRHDGRSAAEVREEIEASVRDEFPVPKFVCGEYEDITFLGVENITDGGVRLCQCHMILPGPRTDFFLRARLTTLVELRTPAGNLAELIVRSVTPPPCAAEEKPDPCAWIETARTPEEQGRMEEAEQIILASVPHQGCAVSIAEMHRRRMGRMLEAGDRPAAIAAFRSARNWICHYAASATSGGEGTALSRERDQFLQQLQSEFGDDPPAD